MNNIRKLLFLFILSLLFSCQWESKQAKIDRLLSLSTVDLLEDFEVFQAIYESANAGLYKYHNKSTIDSLFLANKNRIKEVSSYRAFYNILWEVIDFTGSCHNSLIYPELLNNYINDKNGLFPIPLMYINDTLYTNIAYKDMPVGSEIISINKQTAPVFAQAVTKYNSTDGFNKTGKYAYLATDWLPFYIYLAFGEQPHFDIRYKTKESAVKNIRLPAVNYDTFYINYEQRHSKTLEEIKSENYTFNDIDSIHTGYLSVNTFALGDTTTMEHKDYSRFIDSVFLHLKQKQTPFLIVDIRGNGGGDDPNDLLLYSYLTKRSFRENTSAFTFFQQVPHVLHYSYDDAKELEEELMEEHALFKAGKYYQESTFNRVWQAQEQVYRGKIILLIDPFVASAASLFAALVKSDTSVTVIGAETLGGYYGHTGHIPVSYTLPNAQLILDFSIVDLEQDVLKLADQPYGAGVKPNYRVVQTYHDFLEHKDTPLQFATQYIEQVSQSH